MTHRNIEDIENGYWKTTKKLIVFNVPSNCQPKHRTFLL